MPFIITADETIIELEETRFFPDAFTDETINNSWTKPQHPVANGFTVSDGVFRNPKRVSLSGCVGRQSLNKQGVDIFEGAESRTLAACNFIEAMGNARECVTVDAGNGKIHTNMILVSAPIRFNVGGVMTFNLEFEELQTFATSETFDASLGAEVNIGEVSTTTGEPDNLPLLPPQVLSRISPANGLSSLERVDARVNYARANPEPFTACQGECRNSIACLDKCYEAVFERAGL